MVRCEQLQSSHAIVMHRCTNHETNTYFASAAPEPSAEAILLDVGGMKCGGCAAGVKRRLLERPEVHSAAVNLVTGSAVVSLHSPVAKSLATDLSELLTSQVGSPQPSG